MIELTSIANDIETKLNNLLDEDDNRSFKIFADVGDFKKAYKEYNENEITRYVNGILEAMTPSILPIKNLQAMTQTFRLSLVLDVDALNKDADGNFVEVKEIRAILQNYSQTYNGVPFAVTKGTTTFEVTPSFSGVIVGTESQLSPLGRALPMYLDFSYAIIEMGINTNNVNFVVNGENIFFDSYSITRIRVAETNMVAGQKDSNTFAQSNGISITLKAPLLNSIVSGKFEDDVYNGVSNTAYCVERVRDNKRFNYIMIIGENIETGQIAQNIGQTISFVEGKQDILNYGEGWTIKETTDTSFSKGYQTQSAFIVFWGDGNSEKIKTGTTLTHIYTDGKNHTIKIFSYGNDFVFDE